jgi:hypothetical protein
VDLPMYQPVHARSTRPYAAIVPLLFLTIKLLTSPERIPIPIARKNLYAFPQQRKVALERTQPRDSVILDRRTLGESDENLGLNFTE